MDCLIEGKFVQAKSNGKYIRGEMILDGGGVQRFYINAEQDGEVATKVLQLTELARMKARASVYANQKDGQAYLSVRIVELMKAASGAAA